MYRNTCVSKPPQIGTDDFLRRFPLRAPNLMWLLGAGSSASAGIPTAIDMLWEFKQRLYISQHKVSPQAVADLSNPRVREKLQAHVDSLARIPPAGASDEYAAVFEEVYPSEADRSAYLKAKIAGAKPSYGQLALATLMRAGATRLVWTTNFDPLLADACAKIFDTTGALTTVDLDAPDLATQAIEEGQWPIEIKLHGDFRSRRLKNTQDELRQQDQNLRTLFIDSCKRFGLIVAGYSGRDKSVMDTLEEAAQHTSAFPAGLFWLHRGEDLPSPRVIQLLNQAATRGTEALLVPVDNFDEILRDLIRQIDDIDTANLDTFFTETRRWTAAPRLAGRRSWPVVRFNALQVLHSPSICRRIVCNIGGLTEVREAIKKSAVDVIAVRTRAGVLAFGADLDIRAAFQQYDITSFDAHTFDIKRQRYETSERGLLREGLTRALTRQRNMEVIRRRNMDLLVPANLEDNSWKPLKKLVGSISGNVQGQPELVWREGIGIRLDWANNRLWMLFEPRTVFRDINDKNKIAAATFARERAVKRYNRQLNNLIAFWSEYLSQNEEMLRALGIGDGFDATYKLSKITSFSRRIAA